RSEKRWSGLVRPSRQTERNRRRDGDDLTLCGFDQLPASFVHHPMMPATEGLLPNSSRRPTIWAASFLAYVSAGGAALDGVQSGRAEALPELLVGRRR